MEKGELKKDSSKSGGARAHPEGRLNQAQEEKRNAREPGEKRRGRTWQKGSPKSRGPLNCDAKGGGVGLGWGGGGEICSAQPSPGLLPRSTLSTKNHREAFGTPKSQSQIQKTRQLFQGKTGRTPEVVTCPVLAQLRGGYRLRNTATNPHKPLQPVQLFLEGNGRRNSKPRQKSTPPGLLGDGIRKPTKEKDKHRTVRKREQKTHPKKGKKTAST